MQKKIIALAVAGLMSGAAFAQSNVQIYGYVNMSVDFTDNGNSTNDRTTSLADNSSRMGFRGNEDLGDGLKLLWQYELFLNAGSDISGTNLFGSARDTFIAVQGSWGTFHAGRLSWANTYQNDTNAFVERMGDFMNFTTVNRLTTKAGARKNNLLRYTSPSLSGFTAMVQFAPRDDMTSEADASYQGKLSYANGPLALGLTYTREGNRTDHATTGTEHMKNTALSGSYDFGAVKLGAQYIRVTDIIGVDGADRNLSNLSATWKVTGNGTLKAQHSRAGSIDGTANSAARMWAVGYDHALSKRTVAYIDYAKVRNDSASTLTPFAGGHSPFVSDSGAPAAGRDPSGLSIGLLHSF